MPFLEDVVRQRGHEVSLHKQCTQAEVLGEYSFFNCLSERRLFTSLGTIRS